MGGFGVDGWMSRGIPVSLFRLFPCSPKSICPCSPILSLFPCSPQNLVFFTYSLEIMFFPVPPKSWEGLRYHRHRDNIRYDLGAFGLFLLFVRLVPTSSVPCRFLHFRCKQSRRKSQRNVNFNTHDTIQTC